MTSDAGKLANELMMLGAVTAAVHAHGGSLKLELPDTFEGAADASCYVTASFLKSRYRLTITMDDPADE